MRESHSPCVVTSAQGWHDAAGQPPVAHTPVPSLQPGHQICPAGHSVPSSGPPALAPLARALPAAPALPDEGVPPRGSDPPALDGGDPACAAALPASAELAPEEPNSSSRESRAVHEAAAVMRQQAPAKA
jgi:hypothetical protein